MAPANHTIHTSYSFTGWYTTEHEQRHIMSMGIYLLPYFWANTSIYTDLEVGSSRYLLPNRYRMVLLASLPKLHISFYSFLLCAGSLCLQCIFYNIYKPHGEKRKGETLSEQTKKPQTELPTAEIGWIKENVLN